MEIKNKKSSSVLSFLFKIAILALVYFAAAKFGLSLAVTTKQVTTVWPPTGLALAVLLLFGVDYWPGIFIGAFVANLLTNEPFLVAAGIAVGNTLEAIVGTYLLKRFKFSTEFSRVSDVLKFIFLAAFFGTAVSATVGLSNLILGGIVVPANFGSVWLTWWVGDMMGALVFAPLLLVWFNRKIISTIYRHSIEFIVLFSGLIAVSLFVFTKDLHTTFQLATTPYLVFPFMIWAALRFEEVGVVFATFTVSFIAITGTVQRVGPFATGSPLEQNLITLQIFIFVLTLTSMLLAAAISERRSARTQVEQEEEKWRSLIEFSYDVVCLIDQRADIFYASPSVRQVLGYTQSEFTKMNGLAIVHPDDLDRAKKILGSTMKNPSKPVRIQVRVQHKNSSWRWVEATLNNLISYPSVGAIVVNFRDITTEKEVDIAKTEFVSVASHQLRTPLAILKWYLSVLINSGEALEPEKRKGYLHQVYGANERMIDLVNSLLNVSRIELGRMRVNLMRGDLGETIKTAVKQFEVLAKQKNQKLEVSIAKSVPQFKFDINLMHMVLQNLISNAVKYTPDGGSIKVTLKKEENKAVLMVKDTGIGIPKEEQAKVFEKFHRTDHAKTWDADGNGLGLYIVSNLVAQMGGKLKLESDGKSGTTFYVILSLNK